MRESNAVEVEVRIWIPWAKHGMGEIYGYNEIINRTLAEDFLRPLPRNREIDPYARGRAVECLEKRRRIVDRISAHIAAALTHAITEQDTVDGYDKEELRRGSV